MRVSYHPQFSAFVIGCMRVMATEDNERYFLRFLDHLTFKGAQLVLQYTPDPYTKS